jgi:hypothetical protein
LRKDRDKQTPQEILIGGWIAESIIRPSSPLLAGCAFG